MLAEHDEALTGISANFDLHKLWVPYVAKLGKEIEKSATGWFAIGSTYLSSEAICEILTSVHIIKFRECPHKKVLDEKC